MHAKHAMGPIGPLRGPKGPKGPVRKDRTDRSGPYGPKGKEIALRSKASIHFACKACKVGQPLANASFACIASYSRLLQQKLAKASKCLLSKQ